MLPLSGTTPHADELRPLNRALQVSVRADDRGVPLHVRRGKGQPAAVAEIRDRWRVDGGWWREKEESRMYWELELTTGELVNLYHDLIAQRWYLQPYGKRG